MLYFLCETGHKLGHIFGNVRIVCKYNVLTYVYYRDGTVIETIDMGIKICASPGRELLKANKVCVL